MDWIGMLLAIGGGIVYSRIRGSAPEILGLEKLMDFGFIKSYLTNGGFPTLDPWWAEGKINYYSFGHLLAAGLIKFLGVPAGVGYNLVLVIIFGLGLALSYWAVKLLIGKEKSRLKATLAGLIGAFLVMLAGNSQAAWYFISHRSFQGYWYADATRFIYNTIHEFPSYSFVVSDLHAHVLSLPMVLLFIGLLTVWSRQKKGYRLDIALGVILGMLMMTNSWDTLVYGFLWAVLSVILWASEKRSAFPLLRKGLVVILAAVLTALPWWSNFQSISQGIRWVEKSSPLWQLAVLWTGHLVITVLAGVMNRKIKEPMILALGITAVLLIIIPEIIYFKDIYPNHPRANTMFKLTYQAFIMMGLTGGWLTYQLARLKPGLIKVGLVTIFLAIVGGLGLFPFKAFPAYYARSKNYQGLDGLRWVKERYPAEEKIIEYLESHRDGKNLIEAVGDSYTEYNFISAFSGVPTVVGWRVHEWLWRGGYEPVAAREKEVREFYEGSDLAEAKKLIEKYRLGWVVVTARERKDYQIDRQKLARLAEVVLEEDGGQLWRVR